MPQRRSAEIVRKVALALEHAHRKGIVHRDLKPANVMLAAADEPVVMDFGLAKQVAKVNSNEMKLTRVGGIVGTPSYMSPEQVKGEVQTIGPATDIYSLGVMLFEMLTGNTPYSGSLGVVMGQILSAPVPPVQEFRPDVDSRLDAICRKAMAKEPAARFATMTDFANALSQYLKASSSPPTLAPPLAIRVPQAPPPLVDRSPFDDLGDTPTLVFASKKTKTRRTVAVALALALLVPLVAWLAVVLLRVETPNGTLIVEMNDAEVEARIKNGKLILSGPDGKVRYTLTAKDRSKKLDAGPYKIRVEGADGLVLDTPEFTLKKGGQVKVRVTLEPKAVVKKDTPGKPDLPVKVDRSKRYLYDLHEFDCDVLDGHFKDGGPPEGMVVKGESFKKGLWMHPLEKRYASVKYRLDGLGVFVFEAKVAVNDTVSFGPESPLTFQVLGDGKVLWASKPVTGRYQIEDCSVKVEEIHVLELRVVCQAGYRSAIAAWLDPYLLTTKNGTPNRDPDHTAAAYVISVGGTVRVNEEARDIRVVADLPSEMFRLTHIDLRKNPKVDDVGLAACKGCKNLMVLWLWGTKVSDVGLASFKDCKNLTLLDLAETKLSDVGLAHFKDCKSLTTLYLFNTQVSDAGLAHFKDCKNLMKISLGGTKVTAAGIEELKKALPKCRIN
jgi:hypothetical protein